MIRNTCEDCGASITTYAEHWKPALCSSCQQHRELMEKIHSKEMKKRLEATGTYAGGLDKWILSDDNPAKSFDSTSPNTKRKKKGWW